MRRLDLEKLLRIIITRIDLAFQSIEVFEGDDWMTLNIVATELEALFKGGCDVAEKFFKGACRSNWLPYVIDDRGRVRRLGAVPEEGGRS